MDFSVQQFTLLFNSTLNNNLEDCGKLADYLLESKNISQKSVDTVLDKLESTDTLPLLDRTLLKGLFFSNPNIIETHKISLPEGHSAVITKNQGKSILERNIKQILPAKENTRESILCKKAQDYLNTFSLQQFTLLFNSTSIGDPEDSDKLADYLLESTNITQENVNTVLQQLEPTDTVPLLYRTLLKGLFLSNPNIIGTHKFALPEGHSAVITENQGKGILERNIKQIPPPQENTRESILFKKAQTHLSTTTCLVDLDC